MECVAGVILDPGTEPFVGYVTWEEGVVTEIDRGSPPIAPMAEGIITPLFVNGHTHIGDSCFFGKVDPGLGLERIVNPPDGIKHQLLARTPRTDISSGIGQSLLTMSRDGIGSFLDFREGGIDGIDVLEAGLRGAREGSSSMGSIPAPEPIILSRPSGLRYDRDEVSGLLSRSGGIGVSAMADWEYSELDKLSSHVHAEGKVLAMHASESIREDIDQILELEPDILIHLTSATEGDLERVGDAGIQVVICPRSNALFDLRPDIHKMLEYGIPVSLGTDNLMFSTPDMMAEMGFTLEAWGVGGKGGNGTGEEKGKSLSSNEVLKMAGSRLRKALNVKSGLSQDEKAAFMVLSGSPAEPGSAASSIIRQGRISLLVRGQFRSEV